MFHWEKLGLLFEPGKVSARDWLKEFAQAPCTLIFDDFVRVYFSCRPAPNQSHQYVSYSAFVDLDRRNLRRILRVSEKPILELGGTGTFDEFGTYPVSVIRHDGKVFAYYAGWTRCESVPFNTAIGMAISDDDGVTFNRLGPGPVIPYSPDEPFVMSGPKIKYFNGLFQLFYIAGCTWILHNGRPEPVYKIRLATSNDGLNWKKHGHDLIYSRLDENEAQASPDVIYSNGRYHMFFCYRYGTDYRCKERGYRIGYAHSTNLVDWTRDDTLAGIAISEKGWDSEMISYPHVFSLDGATYMFYLGNEVGRSGFGFARLVGAF